jgi:hypothetical protein
MKKKVYIILGKSNSHKSSVMRCLTGSAVCRGNWMLQFANGDVEKVYVAISSPQERGGKGISVEEFVNDLISRNEQRLFITLQSISTSNQPNGEAYLQSLFDAGFDIQTIVCFDVNANTLNLPVNQYNTRNTPSNQTASEVRKLWGIV